MKDTAYLIADAFGVLRMTKRAPSLGRKEVAVKVTITIPDEAFRSALFGATVDVPSDRVIQPDVSVEAEPIPEPEA
jgi:hypothetical protein